MLIYNLMEDKLREAIGDERIRAYKDDDFVKCEQVLIEHEICYVSNNYLADHLSAK